MGHEEAPKDKVIAPLTASAEDFAICSRLHRRYGTTYYFASRRLAPEMRRRVDAVYGFVRVPDEWVDNPGSMTFDDIAEELSNYRQQLLAASYGMVPTHPVLRAFSSVMSDCGMPIDEPLIFLDAMEQDLTVSRYPTYAHLKEYMRGSACTVGQMLLYMFGVRSDESMRAAADALAEAMQLTNFLRDVGEDLDRGRIYLPLDELAEFGISVEDLENRVVNDAWRKFMAMQIARARSLYEASDSGIEALPEDVRFGVGLARVLYSSILEKIEENGYDVFTKRARTTPQDKVLTAWKMCQTAD